MVETIFSKWSFIPLKSLKDFTEHRQVRLYWVHSKIHYTALSFTYFANG